MERSCFSPSLRILSVLQRWAIVRCQQRQTVADHSFYVTVYADGIADILDWPPDRRLHLLRAALWHDIDEIVTGDIPGPVKRAIPDRPGWTVYINEVMDRHFTGYPRVREDERQVLVAANLLDECAYLTGELRSGNHHVMKALFLSRKRLIESWHQLDLPMLIVDRFLQSHMTMDTPLPGE